MKGFEVKVKDKILKSFPHIIVQTAENIDFNQIKGVKLVEKTSEDYAALLVRNSFNLVQVKGFESFKGPSTDIRKIKKNLFVMLSKTLLIQIHIMIILNTGFLINIIFCFMENQV